VSAVVPTRGRASPTVRGLAVLEPFLVVASGDARAGRLASYRRPGPSDAPWPAAGARGLASPPVTLSRSPDGAWLAVGRADGVVELVRFATLVGD